MKYLIRWFCNKDHKEAWEGFVRANSGNKGSDSFIEVWFAMRKMHKRCIYCSSKLTRARQSTI